MFDMVTKNNDWLLVNGTHNDYPWKTAFSNKEVINQLYSGKYCLMFFYEHDYTVLQIWYNNPKWTYDRFFAQTVSDRIMLYNQFGVKCQPQQMLLNGHVGRVVDNQFDTIIKYKGTMGQRVDINIPRLSIDKQFTIGLQQGLIL